MPLSVKTHLILSASQALLAVIAGAFGAHIVKNMVTVEQLSWWNTGCQYLMYHALACLFCAWHSATISKLSRCVLLFSFGNLIFAGSLLSMALTGATWLGAITPVGGTLYISGWLYLIWLFIKADTIKNT